MCTGEIMTPGIMLSQVWPSSSNKEGETLRALETVLQYGFFKAFQTVQIPFITERKAIAALIKQKKVSLTYCLARVLNENRLNLSDLDVLKRKDSYMKVIECLHDAKEAGACAVSLISGPAPQDERKRRDGLAAFEDSLAIICEKAQHDYDIKIIVEPLDYYAHKRNTLGTTLEAASICESLRSKGMFPYLCIDTAHLLLNDERVTETVNFAKDYMLEFHLCNCVIDPAHPLFGDHHIPFGRPGMLDVKDIISIMKELLKIGYFSEERKGAVFCEVLKRPQHDSISLMKYNRWILETVWKQSSQEEGD